MALPLAAGLLAWALAGPAHAQRWTDADARELASAVAESWTHGLAPSRYGDPETLRTLPAGTERDAAADAAFLALGRDLAFGQVDPRAIEAHWSAPERDTDLGAKLDEALSQARVSAALEALAPQHADYQALREELVYRRAIAPVLAGVEPGAVIRPGDAGARVDALRLRLIQEGLLDADPEPGAEFDETMLDALKAFQARYNLADDGTAGRATLAEINADPERRIGQLRANLERWRWLPADLGERHIRVNLADYRLEAWGPEGVERVHRAMIGAAYNSTPVFSEDMSWLEINPVWYTPERLGRPWVQVFRNNPQRALNNGYRLIDARTGRQIDPHAANWANGRYRVIQRPGPNNAMGQVKFMFPNAHDIYIHDTPNRTLFDNPQRDDSAGCVRVEDPMALARWVLEGQEGWDDEAVEAAFASSRTRRVNLDRPVPVHILYFTAVADADGTVRFVHDVYGRDDALIAALEAGVAG
ncbi:L,D-transpeptidase family protein [Glycocaulis profundi]|nr:L,D-transpeptidase family protein [Glycocaulis profundi]